MGSKELKELDLSRESHGEVITRATNAEAQGSLEDGVWRENGSSGSESSRLRCFMQVVTHGTVSHIYGEHLLKSVLWNTEFLGW